MKHYILDHPYIIECNVMEHSICLKELNGLDSGTYKMPCTIALELFSMYFEFENR